MNRSFPIRPHIADMPGYEPVLPVSILAKQLGIAPETLMKVDANENPYAPFDFVRKALADLKDSNRYPDPESRQLRQALEVYHGVPAENLLAGNGADDLIDLVMRLFLDPGDTILNCPPTFGMYPFDADIQHARVIHIPRRSDFSLDLPSITAAVSQFSPRLIFVTSPNNPDGSLLKPGELDALLALPVVVVLDEAYVEFAPPGSSAIARVPACENLIVLRTFSKWAGLAGLRLGYGAFPLWMMAHLWKIKQPYSVSVAAEAAGLASLQNAAELNRVAGLLISERERLTAGLQRIPWLQIYPSHANFILCRAPGVDGRALKLALAKQGILVRYFEKQGLTDCIRISVGLPGYTEVILRALEDLPVAAL